MRIMGNLVQGVGKGLLKEMMLELGCQAGASRRTSLGVLSRGPGGGGKGALQAKGSKACVQSPAGMGLGKNVQTRQRRPQEPTKGFWTVF